MPTGKLDIVARVFREAKHAACFEGGELAQISLKSLLCTNHCAQPSGSFLSGHLSCDHVAPGETLSLEEACQVRG